MNDFMVPDLNPETASRQTRAPPGASIESGGFAGMWFDEVATGSARTPESRCFSVMTPTPNQLFALYERGEIEREELHTLMAVHARELISEMEEDYQNPAAAWIESLLARRAAGRLERRHGNRLLREILIALAEVPDFPPARHLWNAAHPDVPLYCFLRMRRDPVFRIIKIGHQSEAIELLVEHGDAGRGRATRRMFILKRDHHWRLRVAAQC
jgi:hypothetical protein